MSNDHIEKTENNKLLRKYIFIVILLASILWCTIPLFIGYTSMFNNVSACLSIYLSILACYLYRNNIGLFLMMFFIAYTNYSIAIGVYLFPKIRPDFLYYQFTEMEIYGKAIIGTIIFESFFLLLSTKMTELNFENNRLNNNKLFIANNPFISYLCIIIYIFIFCFYFRFSDTGGRASNNPLLEYRNIFFIVSFCFGGNRTNIKNYWIIIIFLTSLMTLIGGNRADIFASATLLVFFYFSNKINYKIILVMLVPAILVFATVGFMRGGITLDGLVEGAKKLWDSKLTFEGAIYAYIPSLSMIKISESLSNFERIDLLKKHLIYIFTLGRSSGNKPDLSIFSRLYFFHYWGYISPTYFYIWIKSFSGIFFALIVKIYCNLEKNIFIKNKTVLNKLGVIVFYFFVSSYARWYSYGPLGLFRGVFVCVIIAYFFIILDVVMKKVKS